MDVLHRILLEGSGVRFFRQNPDSVNDARPFGRETESVQAFLRAVSAAPKDRAPELLGVAAGWDTAERNRMVTLTLQEARTAGRLQDATAVMRATEVASDKAALGTIAALASPAASTAIETFLRKLGPEEAGKVRTMALKSYVSEAPALPSPDEGDVAKLLAYFFVVDYLIFQAALTLAMRPFMPQERFAALWSPLGASTSWVA